MTQVIRIADSSVINKNHYGLVFTVDSDIKNIVKIIILSITNALIKIKWILICLK